MRFKAVLLSVMLASVLGITFTSYAQADTRHLSYDNFQMSYPASLANSVQIVEISAQDPTLQVPGGPQPANAQITLYNANIETLWQQPDFFQTQVIHIYNASDVQAYSFITDEWSSLQTLLTDRPVLASSIAFNESLPYLPNFPAQQVLRIHPSYVDLATISGIAYVTYYAQGIEFFTTDTNFFYTFQGLSNDGQNYISATFPIRVNIFPSDYPADFDFEAFGATYETYLQDILTQLDQTTPNDFSTPLTTLDEVIASFSIDNSVMQ